MKPLRLAIGLFAAMALLAGTASVAASPYAAGKAYEQRKFHKQHQQQQHRYPPRYEHRPQPQSQWLWENQRNQRLQRHVPDYHRPPPHQQYHRHPPHRDQLRREVHRHSHQLRRGPPLPHNAHLVIGRPLPHGWSHRVPPGHVRHLPQYAGYEWHSAGRDLVLVAVTTGIVYTILDNVLN